LSRSQFNKPKQTKAKYRVLGLHVYQNRFMNDLFYTDVSITYQVHYSIILNNLYSHTYLHTRKVTNDKKKYIWIAYPVQKTEYNSRLIPASS